MKIAVSGTHCSGKSTLVEAFLLAHPEYAHEPEPYVVLQDDYGEGFAAEPTLDDFYRQLEFHAERLSAYAAEALVIYERCPMDFLAYMLALRRAGNEMEPAIQPALALVSETIRQLDLIIYVPAEDIPGSVVPESEHPMLRLDVDARLGSLLCDDDYGLLDAGRPVVVETRGTTAARLHTVEAAMRMYRMS